MTHSFTCSFSRLCFVHPVNQQPFIYSCMHACFIFVFVCWFVFVLLSLILSRLVFYFYCCYTCLFDDFLSPFFFILNKRAQLFSHFELYLHISLSLSLAVSFFLPSNLNILEDFYSFAQPF